MDVGIDEILLVVRVHGDQVALVLGPAHRLGLLVVEQLVDVLQTFPIAVPRPAVRTGVLVVVARCAPIGPVEASQ